MADIRYTNGQRGTVFDPNIGSAASEALSRARANLPVPANETSDGALTVEIGDDGSVYFEPKAPAVRRAKSDGNFSANLAEDLPQSALSSIATDYVEGVRQDIQSRAEFIENYNRGVDLLGLKIESGSGSRGSRTSISKVKHPALIKACIQSQAMSCAELLPPGGPVRVQTVGGSNAEEDDLARQFGDDFNYYMTDVAREYYPDTRRAMFYRAFGGSVFKKVYRCPLRQRPVSESVYLPDLIVGEDALDLSTAQRKTNEITMNDAQVRRMMLRGGWRDVQLPEPRATENTARIKEMSAMGISPVRNRARDTPYTFWEGYVFIDPRDYGIEERGAPEGLPLPYRIVAEKDSHEVVALYRNWRKGDETFVERPTFVKYGLIPGLGFLDFGMLHLIGNSTRVLTAILQIMCDKGMLGNFPGGVKIKGVRGSTNEISPGIGEYIDLEVPDGIDDIRKAIMGMPYGEISTVFIQLMEIIKKDVDELAGTVEMETGEGRTNMPVGTIMAMMEQKSQTMAAVHRQDHQSQKQELQMIRDLFVEHPEDLRWLTRKAGREWRAVEEFRDMDLVPASDPNIPGQMFRLMQSQFLMSVAEKAPQLFGPNLSKVATRVLHAAGINDAEDLVLSPAAAMRWQQQMAGGKPQSGGGAAEKAQLEMPLKMAQLGVAKQKVALDAQENQRQAANEAADHDQRERKMAGDAALAAEKLNAQKTKDAADMAGQGSPDPQAEATVLQKVASAYASMGVGAANFAKAGQGVQEGEDELAGLEQKELKRGGRARRKRKPRENTDA